MAWSPRAGRPAGHVSAAPRSRRASDVSRARAERQQSRATLGRARPAPYRAAAGKLTRMPWSGSSLTPRGEWGTAPPASSPRPDSDGPPGARRWRRRGARAAADSEDSAGPGPPSRCCRGIWGPAAQGPALLAGPDAGPRPPPGRGPTSGGATSPSVPPCERQKETRDTVGVYRKDIISKRRLFASFRIGT